MAQLITMPNAGAAQDTLNRAKQGDHSAFAALVDEHSSMVYSLAMHSLREPAVAEEVAQDVFLALHQHLGEIESPQHLVFWLRKVASRQCIDQIRRRQARPVVSLDELPEPAARAADPTGTRLADQLLARLNQTARMVVVLRYQEDLDAAEIAALLDMPVATVKSHLQRSLAFLRQRFAFLKGSSR